MLNINKEATIVVKPENIQTLLTALSNMPYVQVKDFIVSIEEQLIEQFKEND